MTLDEILIRKNEILAILNKYAQLPSKEFERTDFAKNKEHFKFYEECAALEKQARRIIQSN